jgi:hypothetical protein
MPAANAASEKSERASHIFAAMMDGRSLREIAEFGGLGVRRDELTRRRANPANNYAILQIARLEQALELRAGLRRGIQ